MTTLATPPAAGTAYLEFARRGAATVLARSFSTSPVKLLWTSAVGPACWAYAATLGGGLVGGDEIDVTIEAAPGTRALLATQASTKVYRSLHAARQTVSARVGAGALLVVLPDPVVCFASSDFVQNQRYELHGDASLVVVDWMTSGRHANGERWSFSRYENRIAVTRDARPVFLDALVLEGDLDSVAERMGRFEVLLTAILTGPLVAAAAERIHADISRSSIAGRSDLVLSASALKGFSGLSDGGTLLRAAGVSVEQVGRTLRGVLSFLSPLLGDDPWSRKW